jgi:hypothetical protein
MIEPRRTIIDVVPFVDGLRNTGKYDLAAMPEIAMRWTILQSGFVLCGTECEDLVLTQECVN